MAMLPSTGPTVLRLVDFPSISSGLPLNWVAMLGIFYLCLPDQAEPSWSASRHETDLDDICMDLESGDYIHTMGISTRMCP